MTDNSTTDQTLAEEIRDTLVADEPDEDELVNALDGVIEIVNGSWRIVVHDEIEDREPSKTLGESARSQSVVCFMERTRFLPPLKEWVFALLPLDEVVPRFDSPAREVAPAENSHNPRSLQSSLLDSNTLRQ